MILLQQPPYETQDLVIRRYFLPGTFKEPVLEEAAARLLTLCKKKGAWTGIPWKQIEKQMNADVQMIETQVAIENENLLLRIRYQNDLRKRRHRSLLTLGMYALFTSEVPEPSYHKCLKWKEPHTLISMGPAGFANVKSAFSVLIKEKYIDYVIEEEGAERVLLPTTKLLEAVKVYASVHVQ